MGGSLQVKQRRIASLLAVALICAGFLSPQYQSFALVPTEVELAEGESLQLPISVPGVHAVALGGARASSARGQLNLQPVSGRVELSFGMLPLKTVKVSVVPERRVLLGGQSIGVIASGSGAGVVGYGYFPTVSGGVASPGREAGLRVEDRLTAVDGHPLRSSGQLLARVQSAGRSGHSVRLTVRRRGRVMEINARPQMDRQIGRYRLGIYLRSRTVGVGTLTFVDPYTGAFAALGHAVDPSGGSVQGKIVPAAVMGVERAEVGRPGRKIGVIGIDRPQLGQIARANDVGIGGRMSGAMSGTILPIATISEVRPGPARLYTVLHGRRVESYAVRLERVLPDRRAGSKAITLRVTDPRLIRETGGIIQGMSGSPIVQHGHIVGAVTHVLLRDARRGYAVFAEWMYQELSRNPQAAGTQI